MKRQTEQTATATDTLNPATPPLTELDRKVNALALISQRIENCMKGVAPMKGNPWVSFNTVNLWTGVEAQLTELGLQPFSSETAETPKRRTKATRSVSNGELSANENKVLAFVKNNPKVSTPDAKEKVKGGLSGANVYYALNQLEKKGRVKAVEEGKLKRWSVVS